MSATEDVVFSASVKAAQTRKGSRVAYAKRAARDGWASTISPELAHFIETRESAFLATADLRGQPYIQHRGGPAGFLRVLDESTIGFADFAGNRQYITTGNLAENPKAHLFLIDYANAARVKIWGEARVVDHDERWARALPLGDYRARPEQVILFKVLAWDENCPQHIPRLVPASEVAARDSRIAELEAEIARLTAARA
jgi:hypothetical protein